MFGAAAGGNASEAKPTVSGNGGVYRENWFAGTDTERVRNEHVIVGGDPFRGGGGGVATWGKSLAATSDRLQL